MSVKVFLKCLGDLKPVSFSCYYIIHCLIIHCLILHKKGSGQQVKHVGSGGLTPIRKLSGTKRRNFFLYKCLLFLLGSKSWDIRKEVCIHPAWPCCWPNFMSWPWTTVFFSDSFTVLSTRHMAHWTTFDWILQPRKFLMTDCWSRQQLAICLLAWSYFLTLLLIYTAHWEPLVLIRHGIFPVIVNIS